MPWDDAGSLDDDEEDTKDPKARRLAQAKREKARKRRHKIQTYVYHIVWGVASLMLIFVLKKYWVPQSDWTTALWWIVILSPVYFLVDAIVRIITTFILGDDEEY
jgi:uncharacterized membrane protein